MNVEKPNILSLHKQLLFAPEAGPSRYGPHDGLCSGSRVRRDVLGLQGYLAHKKYPPPQDPPRTLGIGLRYGPRGERFLMSEVPLYGREHTKGVIHTAGYGIWSTDCRW